MSARLTLERLFERAESASSRGASSPVSLIMTQASCPEYLVLQSLDEFETYHAQMFLAERAGCVELLWTRTGGTGRGLQRITLRDHAALAAFLQKPLRTELVDAARHVLEPYRAQFEFIGSILERWRAGKLVRGMGPESASDLHDALRVAKDAEERTGAERLLRSESVRLFGDSKRIEKLVAWLDVIASGQWIPSGLPIEDILAQFGLRRVPQPALLSGVGQIEVSGRVVPIIHPYLGVPPESVKRIEGSPQFVLTIENLTTFHETLLKYPDHQGWLLYTGGMPSPTWRRLYACMLADVPRGCPVYHWGDIDEGGFRIAVVLQRVAMDAGKMLLPWLMSPNAARANNREAQFRPSRAVDSIVRSCIKAGWADLGEEFRRDPLEVEQEALRATLPPMQNLSSAMVHPNWAP